MSLLTTNHHPFNKLFPQNIYTYISDNSLDYTQKTPDKQFSEEQWEGLTNSVSEKINRVFNINQVHGDRVIFASSKSDEIEEADGVITDESNLALVIRTADCLPVFLYDPIHHAVGLIHCGWRSTQKHILKKAIHMMQKYYQTQTSQLKTGFGPALSSCHYKVKEEFLEFFPEDIEQRDGKYFFNLVEANARQLLEEGVLKENISDCQICTFCDATCYSYRRDGDKTGRMLSLIMKIE